MITFKDEVCCFREQRGIYGFNALYDTNKDSVIDEGVVLACNRLGEDILFEVGKEFNIFDAMDVVFTPGTVFEYLQDGGYPLPDRGILPLTSLRYPTREEYEWYQKAASI